MLLYYFYKLKNTHGLGKTCLLSGSEHQLLLGICIDNFLSGRPMGLRQKFTLNGSSGQPFFIGSKLVRALRQPDKEHWFVLSIREITWIAVPVSASTLPPILECSVKFFEMNRRKGINRSGPRLYRRAKTRGHDESVYFIHGLWSSRVRK